MTAFRKGKSALEQNDPLASFLGPMVFSFPPVTKATGEDNCWNDSTEVVVIILAIERDKIIARENKTKTVSASLDGVESQYASWLWLR
jgi:hypothetical protein